MPLPPYRKRTPMFSAATYQNRRQRLCEALANRGLILLLGNGESARNFAHNLYPFRQDSTFLYFFGLDLPGLAAVIDTDSGTETLFGNDPHPDEFVWTGPLPPLADSAATCGIDAVQPADALGSALDRGRPIHTLPSYRAETANQLASLVPGTGPSDDLVRAIVAQRAYKTAGEIEQIEIALDVSHAVHTAAMRLTKPGRKEYEIVAEVEAIAHARGAANSFPTIFSKRGEILHNPFHRHTLAHGDIVVHDSGAESPLHYASDITRTIPVGGKFDPRQRDVYTVVLDSQQAAIDALAPGTPFREIHAIASRVILAGLAELGVVKGDVDAALAADAHTLFFQCGLGHMMGLDVHDMEALGEDFIGYDDAIRRNPAFGWRSLRVGRQLEKDWVMTVEPGIYFNGLLADRWRAEGKCADFIDFDTFEKFRDFGGIRVEDDFLITADGYRLLGEPIPKSIEEVEATCADV